MYCLDKVQLLMSVELSMFSVQSLLQVKERLLKILTFWSDRKLYDKDTMQQLEAALLVAADLFLLINLEFCGLVISHAAPVHIDKAC